MRSILVIMRLFVALLLTLAPVFAQGISREEYRTRRAELRKSLDGVMVLFGNGEQEDLRLPFLQETNFLYLSGWHDPGAVVMLTKNEEILFLLERNAPPGGITPGASLVPAMRTRRKKPASIKFCRTRPSKPRSCGCSKIPVSVYPAYFGRAESETLAQVAPFHDLTPARTGDPRSFGS